jgi:hypothetical protein
MLPTPPPAGRGPGAGLLWPAARAGAPGTGCASQATRRRGSQLKGIPRLAGPAKTDWSDILRDVGQHADAEAAYRHTLVVHRPVAHTNGAGKPGPGHHAEQTRDPAQERRQESHRGKRKSCTAGLAIHKQLLELSKVPDYENELAGRWSTSPGSSSGRTSPTPFGLTRPCPPQAAARSLHASPLPAVHKNHRLAQTPGTEGSRWAAKAIDQFLETAGAGPRRTHRSRIAAAAPAGGRGRLAPRGEAEELARPWRSRRRPLAAIEKTRKSPR